MKKLRLKRSIKDSENLTKKRGNADFLVNKNDFLSKAILSENRPVRKLRRRTPKQHILDANTLSATELRKKYYLTYNTWRNTKERVKGKGLAFPPEFTNFVDFLKHLGPRPNKNYTLDRLDNSNPAYVVGRCQWRDKKAQANNRSNTLHITYKGEFLPLTVWAKRTGQAPDTLRKRKAKGWTDEEIIEGKQSAATRDEKEVYPNIWPGDIEMRKSWELCYQHKGKHLTRDEYFLDSLEVFMAECRRTLNMNIHSGYDPFGEPYSDEDIQEYKKTYKTYRKLSDVYEKRKARLSHKQEPAKPQKVTLKFW